MTSGGSLVKNSLHLKRYVEMHPDNKMAWYLLGKEYEQAGEQGKANYCYNRAEEVYEAFELSKVPSDIWKNYEERLLQMEKERERRRRRIRRMMVAMMLLLLAFIPSVKAPGVPNSAEDILASLNRLDPSGPVPDTEAPDSDNKGPLYIAVPAKAKAANGGASDHLGPLPTLLRSPDQLPPWLVALGMERSGDWLLWSRDMPRLYGVHRASSGAIAIEPYEGSAAECVCEPADSSALKQSAAKWADLQVETAVLSEAARSFRAKHGRLPQSLDELTQPFPNNWLAGRSTTMEAMFDALMERLAGKGGERPGPGQGPESFGQWGTSPSGAPYFNEPLRVIVDRKHHRLAVVSGSILIRNYEVGLGGPKTPLGKFNVSVKVVNPNGTTKGPYGTRGMQLSDTNYAIHGTHDVSSIGANESEGCIRMLKADLEELFDMVPMGTPVTIQDGGLPSDLLVPKERFKLKLAKGQTDPNKEYHWLD